MTKQRTDTVAAAGKLISAIQKEWGKELGELWAVDSEEAMSRGHDLLKAAKEQQMQKLLNGRAVADYIGRPWVNKHLSIIPAIAALEEAVSSESE